MHELAETAGTRLLIAEHPARAVAAIRLWQALEILGHKARQGRRQIVAQRQPLLVIVLEGKHALVRPVLVGQELAERIGIFDERCFHGLETVEVVDLADVGHHRFGSTQIIGNPIHKTARQPRLQPVCLRCHDFDPMP